MAAAVASLSLTSCNSEDDLNTDQYGDGISLTSFGPCPVLRGGTLHFLGSNLDQIVEVDLPDADPITSIEVLKSGKDSEITIQVPAEKCGEGIITLKTSKGGELQTVTPITYREDITVEKFYVGQEGNLVGSVGQTVTIKGDYLNLLHGVIFTENDTVKEADFVSHDRYTIEVAIPKAAKTGRLTLTDLGATPNEIQTDEALEVNLPTVSELSPATIKAGQTLTIKGESLDQIESVKLQGATVELADLTVSADGTTLTLTLPDGATDGEVQLVTYSGVSIAAGSIETVVPTELSAAPSPVKNGKDLTISGKDMDLVASVTFAAGDAVTPSSVTETAVVATVPEVAPSGDATLTLANGKTVTVAYTTVVPTEITFNPATLTAGEKLMIQGKDLDLVASVTFPGDAEITVSEFTAQTETAIGLTTPTAAYGTKVTLTLKNGETVEATGLTINAATDPAVNALSYSGIAGEYVTVEGKNFNTVETVYIGSTKVTRFQDRSATSMTFMVPTACETGTYDFIMTNYDGESFTVGTFEVIPAEVTIWEGSQDLGSWSINFEISGDCFKGQAAAGKLVRWYVEPYADWFQIQIFDGHWGGLAFTNNGSSNNFNSGQAQWTEHPTYFEVELTADEAERLNTLYDWGYCMIVQGESCVLTKITLK